MRRLSSAIASIAVRSAHKPVSQPPQRLRGLIPSLCTPFDDSGAVDLDSLIRLTRFAVRSGADGIACLGLAGEADQLDADEWGQCVSTVVDAVDGWLPVVVGVNTADVHDACRRAQDAERRGATVVMLAPPVRAGWTAAERTDALVQVASSLTVSVMVQEAPAYTGGTVGLQTVAGALERTSNIGHLKIEGGSRALEAAGLRLGDRVSLWGGDGGRHLLDCLRTGAVGVIPGVEIIDRLTAVVAAEAAGDRVGADDQLRHALPWLVFAMESLPGYVACAKAALVRRGLLTTSRARLPGAELGPRTSALLELHLAKLSLSARTRAMNEA